MSHMNSVSEGMADAVAAVDGFVVRVEGRRRVPATGITWSDDGLVVTANHVVRRDGRARVGLPDGTVVEASLVGRDATTDLAVLRAEGATTQPAMWVETEELRVGELVLAVGRPGRTQQATLGIVSALGGEWRTAAGGRVDRYLQTDVLMYPGFSGGRSLALQAAFSASTRQHSSVESRSPSRRTRCAGSLGR